VRSWFRLGFAGLLLPMTALIAAGQEPGHRVADSVAALITRYDRAWNSRDTATVSRLLAPGYQYFTSTGDLSSRVETLRFLSSPSYQLEQARRTEVRIHVTGRVAVASSRWQGRGRYQGVAFTDDQRCGQVWLGAVAGWQLLSEHCTQIGRRPRSGY
jgi:hypothetical protein